MAFKINSFTGRMDNVGVPSINQTRVPAGTDYKYPLGQQWVDTDGGGVYFLASVTAMVATWEKVIGGSTGLSQLTADSGSASPAAGAITIAGGTALTTTGAGSTITINATDATTLQKGVAKFLAADFSTAAGEVSLDDDVIKGVTTDAGIIPGIGHGISIVGGEGIDTSGAGATVTVTGEDASATNKGIASFDAYDFSVTTGAVSLRPGSAVYFVGKWGNDAADGLTFSSAKLTVQAAVTAAPAGSTILVYPGTYTETVTMTANNVIMHGMGKPPNVIIEQVDANVIDFNTRSNIVISSIQIRVTAATTAIATITGTTGSCKLRDGVVRMTTTANIAAAAQPSCANVTSTGTLFLRFSQFHYTNSGNGGGTANKSAFRVSAGGTVDLKLACCSTVTTSGTDLVSSIATDADTTGVVKMDNCDVTMVCGGTIAAALAYLGGTGITHHFGYNKIELDATGCTNAYGFFAADAASKTYLFFNHIHVTGATNNYGYIIGAASELVSHFNDIVAANGVSVAGTAHEVDSLADGYLTVTHSVYAETFDTNIAAAGVTLTGTTLAADGTDANIPITITRLSYG